MALAVQQWHQRTQSGRLVRAVCAPTLVPHELPPKCSASRTLHPRQVPLVTLVTAVKFAGNSCTNSPSWCWEVGLATSLAACAGAAAAAARDERRRGRDPRVARIMPPANRRLHQRDNRGCWRALASAWRVRGRAVRSALVCGRRQCGKVGGCAPNGAAVAPVSKRCGVRSGSVVVARQG